VLEFRGARVRRPSALQLREYLIFKAYILGFRACAQEVPLSKLNNTVVS
jgi:hypothetical protein